MENYSEDRALREKAKRELYLALDVGEQMLISGAEVSRVEDTIERICRAFGAERVDVFTITSSIIVTMYGSAYGPLTQTRRIEGQQTNLKKLNCLNQLSREICQREISMEEIRQRLESIQQMPEQSPGAHYLTFAVISAAFAMFFGGTCKDAFGAAVVGVLLGILDLFWVRISMNKFLSAFLSSFAGGMVAILLVRSNLGDSVNKINIGNIMLLIPGIALTNSMRDMFSGDTISGALRFIESIVLAMTLAFGFVLAYQMGGGIG